MIGAKMTAKGAMGDMALSVWKEGSIIGTGKTSSAIMQRALGGLGQNLDIDLTVDGRGPTQIVLTPSMGATAAAVTFGNLGIRDNVLGMIANAIRSHIISGGNGELLTIDVDL
jgi:hypothetical protein